MTEPTINPLAGRVVVRVVDRWDRIPGTDILLDSRYIYNPYIGTIVAVGEPETDADVKKRDEILARQAAGERCIFSPGNGTEFGTKEMYDLVIRDEAHPGGYQPFAWLANIRLFRIQDFGGTVSGGGPFGEKE